MKNFISLLIITFTLLIISNVESRGQYTCPTGFTSATITMNIGGCNYDVFICYQCDPTFPGYVEVKDIIKHPTTPPCISSFNGSQIAQFVYTYLTSGDFMFSNLCFWNKLSPCPYWGHDISYEFTTCWKEDINTTWFNEPTTAIVPCIPSDKCIVTYEYCIKGDKINKNLRNLQFVNNNASCLEYNEVDPGDCFILHTICNP